MINLKVCGIVAALAFFLSFLIGLISRSIMPTLLIRPVIFAVVFFAISAFINILVSNYLPELLEGTPSDADTDLLPGARIDIMEGDDSEEISLGYSPEANIAVPDQGFTGDHQGDSADDVGDISALASIVKESAPAPAQSPQGGSSSSWPGAEGASRGMDHNGKNEYNGTQGMVDFSKEVNTAPGAASPRSTEDIVDSEEMLPDLDSMAGAFVSSFSSEEPDATEYSVSTPIARKTSSQAKGSEWAGDFNAKDIAAGLRTVLKKDKEG